MSRRGPVGLLLIAIALPAAVPARAVELPQTGLGYEIEVSLDPATRELSGRERIRWTNPSASTTVDRVPLHLYLNAFANQGSTWMRTGLDRFEDVDEIIRRFDDPWGWIEPRAIRQDGVELAWEPIAPDDGNILDRSLIEVRLARPLAPQDSLALEVEFNGRLPFPFARTGGYGDFFVVGQWFPKLAVFETAGVRGATADRWNAHQFHGRTEFYADFADFDVNIGLPSGWAVAATGRRGPETTRDGRTWHRFRQRAVHDFAFATGSDAVDVVSTHDPKGPGGPVEIHVFLPRHSKHQAERWRRAVEGSLDTLGSRIGPYPYETLSIVMPPFHLTETWGMEYPTLFTGLSGDPLWDVGNVARLRLNEATIAHEFAHQYFYGLLATNEFEEAFLDEGFTEFWGDEILRETYGEEVASLLGRAIGPRAKERLAAPRPEMDLPPLVTRPSFLARGYAWGVQFYSRPAAILRTAEGLFGRATLDRVFAAYYDRWAFRHPSFEDFLDTLRAAGGDAAADFFVEASRRTSIPDYRVEAFDTERWKPPRGRIVTGKGVLEADTPRENDHHLTGLDPAAREESGKLTVEILDPGSAGGDRWGRIERITIDPKRGEAEPDWKRENDVYHASEVRIAGPGWDHLPVEVQFLFADGVIYRERWDGRAPYRGYRFVRPAPLSEVRIDPEGKIVLDPDPANNGRLREPDTRLARDWAAWFAGVMQLMLEGVSQWL
jgi:hypothetical protein